MPRGLDMDRDGPLGPGRVDRSDRMAEVEWDSLVSADCCVSGAQEARPWRAHLVSHRGALLSTVAGGKSAAKESHDPVPEH